METIHHDQRHPTIGQVKVSPQVAEQFPSRDDDELLLIDEVAKITRRTVATERYLRHTGQTNYLWRNGRRLVAWRSEVIADLDRQRAADRRSA